MERDGDDDNQQQESTSSFAFRNVDDGKTREVRRHYRKLLRETREEREELLQPGNESLTQKVDEANECFKYVKSPREGVLDSRFMTLAVEIASKKTKQVDTNYVSFDYNTYVDKVNAHMDVALKDLTVDDAKSMEKHFWEEYDRMTNDCWTSIVPTIKPILGALEDVEEKRRRQARRDDTKLSERGKLLQPERVSGGRKKKDDNSNKEATPAEIEKIFSIIKGLYRQDPQPIDFFELVIHPTDFGRTVMNIFHLSFLVKDGYVRLFLDERQLPVLEPKQQNSSQASASSSNEQDGGSKTNQMAVSLSKDEWREAIKVYQLAGKEPLIP